MNRIKNIAFPILASSFLLFSCGGETLSSSESASSEMPSPEGHFDLWTEEQKGLMEEYCGSLLPYPVGISEGGFTFLEQGSGESKYLLILNESEEWTLEGYYETLEGFGWDAIAGFSDKIVQTRDDVDYVELTKDGPDGTGYEMMYYHLNDVSLSSSSSPSSYNCIACYNSYSSSLSEGSDWSASDKEKISCATTTSLPFIALGKGYTVSLANEDEVDLYDYCTKDISREYQAILRQQGYFVDLINSSKNNGFYLYKNFPDGSKVQVLIRYFRGNNISVYYTPKITSYSEWPSALVSPFEEETGVRIPSFPVAEGGIYYAYQKHGVTYLCTYDLSSSYDYYDYVDEVRSELYCWEENASVSAYLLRDDSQNDVGFIVYFEAIEPQSAFTSSWPEEGIENGIKDSLGVEGVEIPSLDVTSLSLAKPLKYKVTTQSEYDEVYEYYLALLEEEYGDDLSEESIENMAEQYAKDKAEKGVLLSVCDSVCEEQKDVVVRYKVNEAYKELLYRSCWYKAKEDGTVYEDPTGQVAIEVLNTPYSDFGYTSISFTEGSGVAHSPVFAFKKDSYEISVGGKVSLSLNVNMLPYDVSYSCSDESGEITVDSSGVVRVNESVNAGTVFSVKASCVDKNGKKYEDTCSFTVVKALNYTTVLEEVESLLKAKGYSSFTEEDLYTIGSNKKVNGKKVTVNLGSSLSKSEAKSMVKESLIPEHFISSVWGKVSDEEDDAYLPLTGTLTKLGAAKLASSSSTPSDLEKLYCYYSTDYAYMNLTYYLYTASNGDLILYVESRGFSR